MLQEDSNGESSFEFVDKKNQSSNNAEKTESLGTLSSVSSAYSIPSPSLVNIPTGNLLSNVPPPSTIPDFTLWPSPTTSAESSGAMPPGTPQTVLSHPQHIATTQPTVSAIPLHTDQFPSTQFSAAIPPSKGIQHGSLPQHAANESEHASGGIMGIFKEAFSSGGVLSKMAEKAKSSVDSIITTLDPQMSEYIYSGGDTEVTVTSENVEEVEAVREAFHSTFGKAWVNGIKLNVPGTKPQAVGLENGINNAEEKLNYSLKYPSTPTVAIENILLQQSDNWFDLSVLILKDTEKQITVRTFSQATPIPVDKILKEIDSVKPEYKSFSIEEKLATYLQTKPNWQTNISGLTRKEVVLLAAKCLVKMYKDQLSLIK
ncbi:hypothetical protein NQ318_022589 [Aromia moschata]|uniref:Uncharacterized protein n=1 Tax=Aromia moschata TaxID=1265417 RepID=A0AAV8XWC0_9CUCU|nr:hypothetical protein NQ318_022589 [Aromia moschata]